MYRCHSESAAGPGLELLPHFTPGETEGQRGQCGPGCSGPPAPLQTLIRMSQEDVKVPGTLWTESWGHQNPIRGPGVWRHLAGPGGCSPPPPRPSPQLTRLWEGAGGPIQETGQHARVSGQTMSCLSQAAVPGAGCAPEDAPSAVSRPSTPPVPPPTPAQLPVQPTPTSARGTALQGGKKAPCGAQEHLYNMAPSEAAIGDCALSPWIVTSYGP